MFISRSARNLTARGDKVPMIYIRGAHDLHTLILKNIYWQAPLLSGFFDGDVTCSAKELQAPLKKKKEAVIHQGQKLESWLEGSVKGVWVTAALSSAPSIIPLPLAAITHCPSHTHILSKNGCFCNPSRPATSSSADIWADAHKLSSQSPRREHLYPVTHHRIYSLSRERMASLCCVNHGLKPFTQSHRAISHITRGNLTSRKIQAGICVMEEKRTKRTQH